MATAAAGCCCAALVSVVLDPEAIFAFALFRMFVFSAALCRGRRNRV